MLRTYVYVGLGHTNIRLPGASEKTEVPENGEISVDDSLPTFKTFEKILKANQFKESGKSNDSERLSNTADVSLSTPENGAAVRVAKNSRKKS
jgi:hypothetical protein